jgi:hypothetical protein
MYAKTWVAMIPLVTATLMSMTVAFVNNYLTRKRNKGQEFFPGMVGPDGKPIGLSASAQSLGALTPVSVFQVFQRFRSAPITAFNSAPFTHTPVSASQPMIREVIA